MEKITAKEGMYLTQKNLENENGRVFAISLYLADNDSADNWRDATQQEYYEWQRKQDKFVEDLMASDIDKE
mgnify:FL=1